jgi:NTE family protein
MKKLGLALSSGGARGLAHVGVIKVLRKNNIPIDHVAGTSMGALVAAYYALNDDIMEFEKLLLKFRKRDLLKLIDVNDPRVSLVKGEKVRKFLKNLFGNKTFKDTKIPLKIGATALENGSKVIFSTGKIIDAVMASGAFPGVFPVVKYKRKHLVDGGLADATPVDLVKKMGADVIVAVDLFSLEYYKNRRYQTMKEVLERTYEIIMSKLADYKEKEYGKNIIVLKPKTGKRIQTFAFYNAKKNIRAGEIEAEKHLRKIKRLLK